MPATDRTQLAKRHRLVLLIVLFENSHRGDALLIDSV